MADNYFKNTIDNKWRNTTDNKWTKVVVDVFEPYYSEEPEVVDTPISPSEYGRRPSMRGDYHSMMRRPTDRGIWNKLESKWGKAEKHSEFKKPYLFPKEDYSEMEHFYPSPHISLPNPLRPTPAPAPHGWVGWYIIGCSLTCTPSIIRDCNKKYCCTLNPAWQPVESIKITGPATLTREGRGASRTGNKICFTVDDDAVDGDHIKIKVKTRPKPGQEKIGFCEGSFRVACDKCDCGEADYFYYDDPNSDDTVDRDGIATIVVIGGCPPFTWSVAGTGFSIPSSTTGRTNTLSADDTACGLAAITVTDKCGDTCTGDVKCTTGQWAVCASFSQGGCCYPPGYPCNEHTVYEGKYRWIVNCGNRSGYGVDSWNPTCNGVGMSIKASDVCQSGWKICTGGLYEWTC
ncbi:MAG: hypothetical protein KAX30_04310 [Candidatus Atribacteria bacterium]|nr:hypothetical protein [Candidatus Atribacteria bacterium]